MSNPHANNTEINWPLLERVIEHIIDHPEEWNQEVWIRKTPGCGTQACIAGWAALFAGYHPIDTPWYRLHDEGENVYAILEWNSNGIVSRGKMSREQITEEMGVELPEVVTSKDQMAALDPTVDAIDKFCDTLVSTGRATYARKAARKALGLGEVKSGQLFDPTNSIQDILGMIQEWADHDGWELSEKIRAFEPADAPEGMGHPDFDVYFHDEDE